MIIAVTLWYFLTAQYGGTATQGPFESKAQCEEARSFVLNHGRINANGIGPCYSVTRKDAAT